MRMIPFGIAILSVLATTAAAKPHLRDVAEIDNGLLAVGIADEIRKNCDSIKPRIFRALSYVEGLKSRARELGYSDAEIKAYYKSDAEKARVRAKGEAYLAANGVNRTKPETFCDLGRAEIARGSQIGAFLRAR